MKPAIDIPGLLTLSPKRIGDERGYFCETWKEGAAPFADLPHFVQDNESLSRTVGTLRGLHFQKPPQAQAKLVRCARGAILDIAVDIRVGSPTFGAYAATVLSADNGVQFFMPIGFAHGFVTLEPDTLVQYKVSAPYARECDMGLAFDDPAIGVDWRLAGASPTLSDRDRTHPLLADLPEYFRFGSV